MAASARDCIFCKIVRREVPASIVRDDSSTLAFMDFRPMSPGHVLVIPKAHAANVEDLPPEAVGPILEAAKEISRAMRERHPVRSGQLLPRERRGSRTGGVPRPPASDSAMARRWVRVART